MAQGQLLKAGQNDQLAVTGTLNVTKLSGFSGSSFTLIANDSTDAVSRTFSGLAEGATFSVSGTTFQISYVGGSGNDVVLTVV